MDQTEMTPLRSVETFKIILQGFNPNRVSTGAVLTPLGLHV